MIAHRCSQDLGFLPQQDPQHDHGTKAFRTLVFEQGPATAGDGPVAQEVRRTACRKSRTHGEPEHEGLVWAKGQWRGLGLHPEVPELPIAVNLRASALAGRIEVVAREVQGHGRSDADLEKIEKTHCPVELSHGLVAYDIQPCGGVIHGGVEREGTI